MGKTRKRAAPTAEDAAESAKAAQEQVEETVLCAGARPEENQQKGRKRIAAAPSAKAGKAQKKPIEHRNELVGSNEPADAGESKEPADAGEAKGKDKQAVEPVAVQKTPTPRSAPSKGEHGLVVIHWNVAGLNGLLKSPERRKLLISLIAAESPHVLALSEHKISEEKLHAAEAELKQLVLGKYTVHWAICTAKKGYSGMLMLIRKGVAVQSIKMNEVCSDLNEGRTVTAELDAVYVVATYVPNSGQDLKRLQYRIGTWDVAMREYIATLQKKKPVVLIGDMNVAHLDEDIWNVTAKHVPKSAGLTPEERASFGTFLAEADLIDAFRILHPDARGCFSYWSTRSGNHKLNRGLRLDYALLSKCLGPDGAGPLRLRDVAMMQEYAPNGDHAPTLVALEKQGA